MSRIYLDYVASTPLDPRVKSAMEPFGSDIFANAGSNHTDGIKAQKVINESRKTISKILGVKQDEIIFTSGGTESNNLAIIGFLNYLEDKGGLEGSHIITSSIEHPSVLEIFQKYKRKGLDVDFAPITSEGLIDLDKFKALLKPETVLVSITYVNSEIGTIQPLKEISKILKSKYQIPNTRYQIPVLHTDASQAPVWLSIKVDNLGVDMMTLDGQKIYGPKGVGVLYKKASVNISPILLGGGQEGGLRPGTENTPLVAGVAKALEIVESERDKTVERILPLRDYFIDSLLKLNDKIVLNGSRKYRSANNVNISVLGEDSEFLQIKLDKEGISCSTKSACLDENEEGSYVLKALGNPDRKSGLRFSLGRETTREDIDGVIQSLKRILS